MAGCLWPCATDMVSGGGAGHRKRGLFGSKPRTPPEVVQHVTELLTYNLDHKEGCGSDKRDPKLEHKTQKDVTQVIANLQRQKVDSRLVASQYLEANSDLLDILMSSSYAYLTSPVMFHISKDESKAIQAEVFHVFKLFVLNKEKPPEITHILHANRNKLLRFLKDFSTVEKEDKKFEADKGRVISEILTLVLKSS
ncbi:hypothetical protein BAE44_0010717 [Dichanthelium oligosanthes]|uniref:MO25-like protein n=1 Tax=Dichanthelium oligosanthes TaxID=888268 RepID=A0A1E5VT07_9POAL|nr:hypothetical protein BAE44_0010717 [Dichanthelium oligosanthes]